ncbi:hypothetical protein [Nocardioides yefusunii]|uniref:Uncharacterized protein n=1 Tax=Nocardioides yefusunii TaxID=2500546 RepID=A0ABW1QZW3_9ACTN|nr:hypothetical protein [Nocardioides yefusunii]
MAESLLGGATPTHASEASGSVPEIRAAQTGVAGVDRVLSQVVNVHELPVAERVAVFERVHDELRRSLDADQSAARPDDAGA